MAEWSGYDRLRGQFLPMGVMARTDAGKRLSLPIVAANHVAEPWVAGGHLGGRGVTGR